MTRALVGSTGFVGGTLLRSVPFEAQFRSTNATEMRGGRFDLFVVAGAPAEKWKANRDPDRDRGVIAGLIDNISAVDAAQAILISTVDVYPAPIDVDEDTPIDPGAQHAYGRHRLQLEEAFRARFPRGLVVRLPALFGTGLKKNAVYDLLHDNEVHKLNARAAFQFYDMSRLWADLQRFLASGVRLLNVTTEPVTLGDAAREAFGMAFDNDPGGPPARYDVRTRHDGRFGGRDGYFYDRASVLTAMRQFVESERR